MDIFTKLKSAIKLRSIKIDNEIFQLHYRATFLMLLGSSFLVVSKQHFGDPIECMTKHDSIEKILDTYCWIHSTFIVPKSCNETTGVLGNAQPCVEKYVAGTEEKRHQTYYQWVYFLLAFQALLFKAPHYLWKTIENKLIYQLCEELEKPIDKQNKRKEKSTNVSKYLFTRIGYHNNYFYSYVLCEGLNFINVIAQMYIVDWFLGGTFTTYGLDVFKFLNRESDERIDPMIMIFPKLAKCTFHIYGSSGDVQRHDALCILPLNIINEKIYIIMWAWFVILGSISGVWLIYRLFTIFNENYRIKLLARRASLVPYENIEFVVERVDIGDWFLILMVCKNSDSQAFEDLMRKFIRRIKLNEKNTPKSIRLAAEDDIPDSTDIDTSTSEEEDVDLSTSEEDALLESNLTNAVNNNSNNNNTNNSTKKTGKKKKSKVNNSIKINMANQLLPKNTINK